MQRPALQAGMFVVLSCSTAVAQGIGPLGQRLDGEPDSRVHLFLPELAPNPALPASPPPQRLRYGWQSVVADLSWMAVTGLGLAVKSDALTAVGLIGYPFAGPSVHWAHGATSEGAASLARRILYPAGLGFGLGLLGVLLGGAGDSGCSRECYGRLWGAALGAIAGIGVGALVAMGVDAASTQTVEQLQEVKSRPRADPIARWFIGGGGVAIGDIANGVGGGVGFTVDAGYDAIHGGLHVSALIGSTKQSYRTSSETSLSLIGIFVPTDRASAPYFGVGFGWLRETGGYGWVTRPGSGPALTLEGGWQFLRDRRWGRLALSVRAIVPLFAEGAPVVANAAGYLGTNPAFPIAAAGVRFMM